MFTVRLRLTIAAKLAVAYGLFLTPIGFLAHEMIADKQVSIEFGEKEISGVHYISEVRGVQDAVLHGCSASFSIEGAAATRAVIRDISRSGVVLLCNFAASPATEATVSLPTSGSVLGRVVRSDRGLLTIAFRQDAATITLLDNAIEAIRGTTNSAAA